MIKVTREDFSVEEVIQSLKRREVGGIVTFIGTVRGESQGQPVERLEIEAYEEMALRDLEDIRRRALEMFGVEDAAIIHRIGTLKVSENIILIAVAAAHREEAFEACRFILEEVKRLAPIWKKEHYCERKGITPKPRWATSSS
jgi:molybdopterin synthase catalytic subunit